MVIVLDCNTAWRSYLHFKFDFLGSHPDPRIMHRLPPTERGQKPFLNTVQPDLHPVEILFDVKKLMQVQNVRDSLNEGNVHPTWSSRNNRYQRLSRRYISSLGGTTSGLTFTGTFYGNGTKMLFMRFTPLSGASQVGIIIPIEYSS